MTFFSFSTALWVNWNKKYLLTNNIRALRKWDIWRSFPALNTRKWLHSCIEGYEHEQKIVKSNLLEWQLVGNFDVIWTLKLGLMRALACRIVSAAIFIETVYTFGGNSKSPCALVLRNLMWADVVSLVTWLALKVSPFIKTRVFPMHMFISLCHHSFSGHFRLSWNGSGKRTRTWMCTFFSVFA